jgi:hypothetical protein
MMVDEEPWPRAALAYERTFLEVKRGSTLSNSSIFRIRKRFLRADPASYGFAPHIDLGLSA